MVVKFACGLGVSVYHADGGLAAIWPLGRAKLLPDVRERVDGKLVSVPGPPELGAEYFVRPNMRPADGYHVKYGRAGDLRWIITCKDGALNGPQLRFAPEGVLRPQDSGLYKDGTMVERWQESLLPEGFIAHVLSDLVLPMKKALGIGLSPCEERLCYENFVDVDGIEPIDLNIGPGEGPEGVEKVSARTEGYREWWRPQVQLRDPSKVYDFAVPYEFAPLGPSVSPVEVSPFRPQAATRHEGTYRMSAVCLDDADADLRDIFSLGKAEKFLSCMNSLTVMGCIPECSIVHNDIVHCRLRDVDRSAVLQDQLPSQRCFAQKTLLQDARRELSC